MEKLISVVEAFGGKDLYVTGTCSGGMVYSFEVRNWEYEQYERSLTIFGGGNSSVELSDSYDDIYEEDGMWTFEYKEFEIIISCIDEQNKD